MSIGTATASELRWKGFFLVKNSISHLSKVESRRDMRSIVNWVFMQDILINHSGTSCWIVYLADVMSGMSWYGDLINISVIEQYLEAGYTNYVLFNVHLLGTTGSSNLDEFPETLRKGVGGHFRSKKIGADFLYLDFCIWMTLYGNKMSNKFREKAQRNFLKRGTGCYVTCFCWHRM